MLSSAGQRVAPFLKKSLIEQKKMQGKLPKSPRLAGGEGAQPPGAEELDRPKR